MHRFRQMIRYAPQLNTGYSNLGGLLVLRGEYASAIDTLNLSIQLNPSEIAFDNLGTAYCNTGRFAEAVEAYNQAFQFGMRPTSCGCTLAKPTSGFATVRTSGRSIPGRNSCRPKIDGGSGESGPVVRG